MEQRSNSQNFARGRNIVKMMEITYQRQLR